MLKIDDVSRFIKLIAFAALFSIAFLMYSSR